MAPTSEQNPAMGNSVLIYRFLYNLFVRKTPLQIAIAFWATSIVEFLAFKGASLEDLEEYGVYFCANNDDVKTAQALIAFDADVNTRCTHWNETPLVFAIRRQGLQTIRLLLDVNASLTGIPSISEIRDLEIQSTLQSHLQTPVNPFQILILWRLIF